jgi:hypothetical protein
MSFASTDGVTQGFLRSRAGQRPQLADPIGRGPVDAWAVLDVLDSQEGGAACVVRLGT